MNLVYCPVRVYSTGVDQHVGVLVTKDSTCGLIRGFPVPSVLQSWDYLK